MASIQCISVQSHVLLGGTSDSLTILEANCSCERTWPRPPGSHGGKMSNTTYEANSSPMPTRPGSSMMRRKNGIQPEPTKLSRFHPLQNCPRPDRGGHQDPGGDQLKAQRTKNKSRVGHWSWPLVLQDKVPRVVYSSAEILLRRIASSGNRCWWAEEESDRDVPHLFEGPQQRVGGHHLDGFRDAHESFGEHTTE
ncbi:hypothetical protein NCS52_00515200 [Fusarium sp. LHS14.1]|nr:hypothetical protein NCS52_00515200 [Fusarium sp. LHS14.1]